MLGNKLGCFVHDGSDVWRWQDDPDGLGLRGKLPHIIQIEPSCKAEGRRGRGRPLMCAMVL